MACASLDVELLGVGARITAPVAEASLRLGICYGAMIAGPAPPPAAIAATLEPDAGGFRVEVSGRPEGSAPDVFAAIRILNHELMHAAMLRAPRSFYVHAGVVAARGRAVILPGLSQAGKSTLVLALVERGAQLLSDELLVFDPAIRCVRAFPRAIKVRDVCLPYFDRWKPWFVGEGEGRLLDPRAIADRIDRRAEVPPGSIVVPRYDAGGDDVLRPLTRGEALLALTASALNFGTHRGESLSHLATLCEGTRTWSLRWRDPHRAAAAILSMATETGP